MLKSVGLFLCRFPSLITHRSSLIFWGCQGQSHYPATVPAACRYTVAGGIRQPFKAIAIPGKQHVAGMLSSGTALLLFTEAIKNLALKNNLNPAAAATRPPSGCAV